MKPETPFDAAAVEAEAQRLDAAERNREQVRQTTLLHPDLTIDDAYRIQDAWRAIRLGRGEHIVGHKIGLTSRAMQTAMRIDTPDSGFLTDSMMFDEGEEIEAGAYTDARIEVELAFVLGRDLGGERVSIGDVLAATEYVVPALELIAARTHRVDPESGRARTVVDTIADNAANGGVISGGRPIKPDALDLRWVGALLYRNGVLEETGLAAAVLNHPARGIAWLARRYAALGRRLEAGQVVLAGSFTRPINVAAGDIFHADYGPLGSIAVRFV